MKSSFLWPILICLVPNVIALSVDGLATYRYANGEGGFKLGVDLVGGTILVYEIDPEKKPKDYKGGQELAASLKRRIDPADLYNVTIRPVSDTRVEIILPTGGRHQYAETAERRNLTSEQVQQMKELIARQGSLEFRILANPTDDGPALKAAQEYFEKAKTDAKEKADLDRLRREGKPPPSPGGGKAFPTDSGIGDYTYSWVELGKSERHDLLLNNAVENDSSVDTSPRHQGVPRNLYWKEFQAARDKGEKGVGLTVGHPSLPGCLYYSRVSKDDKKKIDYFVLVRDPAKGKEVTGQYLTNAKSDFDQQKMKPSVSFSFNSQGAQLFREMTSKNLKRPMAIVLDGQVMSVATIQSTISDSGQITGSFSEREVNTLVSILRAGALPATLKPVPVSENTIGPTLGDDTIRAGAFSVGLAFLAILVFMLFYYRFAGLVACVALLSNLFLTVAFMVIVKATFTLPGLAGLVLMLGMAVDANVLIYERLREERDRGASLALAIRNGYDRAFPTIIDTHLSSIFTAIVLYIVGNDQLKGFGISLTVGLVISLFTSLYLTRTLFNIWQSKNWLHKLSMMRLFSRPNIDFMGIRYYWFTATILLTILGATLFFYRLPSASGTGGASLAAQRRTENSVLNIDFIGGTAYTGLLKEAKDIKELRERLSEQRQHDLLNIKEVIPEDPRGRTFEITLGDGEVVKKTLPGGEATARQVQDDPKLLSTLLNVPAEPPPAVQKVVLTDPNPRAFKFTIVYSDDNSWNITLPNLATTEEVKKHASELPDLSVEQIFLGGSSEFSQGSKSRLFTIRTSEKAPELVQASIDRLLGDWLKKVDMKYTIASDQSVHVQFFDHDDPSKEVYASPAQLQMLLEREFRREEVQAPDFDVHGAGQDDNGRYRQMDVELTAPMDRAKLKAAMDRVQDAFSKRPQPERLENFDSQLAAETQTRALYAILASWGAILLYLWFRFGNWTFGLAAVLCLIHDLFFTLGIIAACHYIHNWFPGFAGALMLQDFKIDLPTVAALLTLVGYSVNDTIVVFDRIREVRGKNPDLTPKMINDSVNQTLSRTLLTSFATWLVVIVLYIWGGEGVHLFAFVMVVGVIVGTYSSIYIASPLLLIFGEGARPAHARERQAEAVGAPG